MEYYKILDRYKLVREQQEDGSGIGGILDLLSGLGGGASAISNANLFTIPVVGQLTKWAYEVFGATPPGWSSGSLNDFLFHPSFFTALMGSELTRLDPYGFSRLPYFAKGMQAWDNEKSTLNAVVAFLGVAAVLYPRLSKPIGGALDTITKLAPKFLQPVLGIFCTLLLTVLYASPLLVYWSTMLDDYEYDNRPLKEVVTEIFDYLKAKGEEFKNFLINKYNELKVLKTKHNPDKNLFQHLQTLQNIPRTPAKYGGPQLMGGRPGGTRIAPARSTRFGQ